MCTYTKRGKVDGLEQLPIVVVDSQVRIVATNPVHLFADGMQVGASASGRISKSAHQQVGASAGDAEMLHKHCALHRHNNRRSVSETHLQVLVRVRPSGFFQELANLRGETQTRAVKHVCVLFWGRVWN
jgi:predicted component of type VI protein secretion system